MQTFSVHAIRPQEANNTPGAVLDGENGKWGEAGAPSPQVLWSQSKLGPTGASKLSSQ